MKSMENGNFPFSKGYAKTLQATKDSDEIFILSLERKIK